MVKKILILILTLVLSVCVSAQDFDLDNDGVLNIRGGVDCNTDVYGASNCESKLTEVSKEFWAIGNIKLENTDDSTQSLRVRSFGKSSLRSYSFVGKVGGVNFEQTVAVNSALKNAKIHLFYNPDAPDGSRLSVKIDDESFDVKIPDWLLIPIAYFTDSEFTAVISLFGNGPDTDNYYYIQYHPAFHNTLLGIRLLQADILLMDPKQHITLPKKNGHKTVLGKGEFISLLIKESDQNKIAIKVLYQKLSEYQYTAWVLTDAETTSSFTLKDGDIEIYSSPYYYFWDKNNLKVSAHNRAVNAYNNHVDEYNLLVKDTKKKVSEYNSLVVRFNVNNSSIPKSQLSSLQTNIKTQQLKLASIEEELKRLKNDIEEGIEVEPVTQLTNYLKTTNIIQEINPIIHNAVETTSSFASFFRYIKIENHNNWREFIKSLANVKVKPNVKTPSRIYKKRLN